MFSTISNFITSIGEVGYELPYYVKMAFILFLIILATSALYVFNDMFKKGAFRDSYLWYYLVIIFNLFNILLIVGYYNYHKDKPGEKGKPGKIGKKGERGKYMNCAYCDYTLFFQKTKRYNSIANLKNNPSNTVLEITKGKFKDLIEGDNVNYGDFLMDIIMGGNIIEDKIRRVDLEYARLIKQIMYQKELILQLYIFYINKNVNFIKNNNVGTIMRPYSISGYLLLGDSIKGGFEDFKLNSFLVAPAGTSESLYPIRYKKLATFNSFDSESNSNKQFSIWRAVGQEINGLDELGNKKKFKYHPIGDICVPGTTEPDRNILATINEKCLEPVKEENLSLITIYYDQSSFTISNSNSPNSNPSGNNPSYNNLTRDFTIDAPTISIEMFSLWRTPLNTFTTNYINDEFKFTNNSIAYNLIGGNPTKIDEFNNVTMKAKRNIINRLKNIKINKLQTIFILINHYSYKYLNELKYYFYRVDSNYQSQSNTSSGNEGSANAKMRRQINELKKEKNIDYSLQGAAQAADNATTIKQLLDFYEQAKEDVEEFNKLRASRLYKEPNKPVGPKKIIPSYLINVVKKVKSGLFQIDSKIDEISNLNDLVNDLFEGGVNYRIAIDNEGIAMGGHLLNFSQEILLYICKIIMPPDIGAYNIKEECIGVGKIDKERRNLTLQVEKVFNENKKLLSEFKSNPTEYCTSWESVMNYQDLCLNKIGKHVGHIENYYTKIENMELEEFTKSRLKIIIEEYEKLNNYIQANCSKEKEYEFTTDDLRI